MASKGKGKKGVTFRVRTDDAMAAEVEKIVEEMGETASVVIREAIRLLILERKKGRKE